ncbi:protocatechuate 3,4-dioxygenase subunit alpha [Actinokineospora cianjurensis]|uniref:Protocatechuate 3,4-dioxygenase alpha subunit n=1 Tax=Actinokineospora cianjurensis TaxID=585224 RepID=A0A421B1N1_9PSEU|nr:protocatechuate 3,4-dioxygenase subunit alpha [Actinokineospora cianjurensis]RLK58238.1 protocatechuate 3,4-dioxygenase alpha subunit [Actinokineospora cianjurensis]
MTPQPDSHPHAPGWLPPTPAQTVGPFFGYALPFTGGGHIAGHGDPDTITVHGRVFDGASGPVPDALVEIWQADRDGCLAGAPGSLRHDQVTSEVVGRDGTAFTGFGRVPTDADGHWAVRTVAPGPHRPGATPYLAVAVFARGLLRHLYTRVYLPEQADHVRADFPDLPAERLDTLLAVRERDGLYRFDIRLQGERETVFFDFC